MAGSRREKYLQNIIDAINGDELSYPGLVAGIREEYFFQNIIDAAKSDTLTYPNIVPVWTNPEKWYANIVAAVAGETLPYSGLVAGTRDEMFFQNMIDAASGNDLTYPDLVPVWKDTEELYYGIADALENREPGELTDLSGTKWLWNDAPNLVRDAGVTYSVIFTSNETVYDYALSITTTGKMRYMYNKEGGGFTSQNVYTTSTAVWNNANYKTIEFAQNAGTDAKNAELIALLQANATRLK